MTAFYGKKIAYPYIIFFTEAFHLYVIRFESELKRTPGVTCWRVMKEPGKHVTPWWLYARLNPGGAHIQFGETTYAGVNDRPHMWVRGKDI